VLIDDLREVRPCPWLKLSDREYASRLSSPLIIDIDYCGSFAEKNVHHHRLLSLIRVHVPVD
jgi:hypothetical protein